jgi:hypothetical protein
MFRSKVLTFRLLALRLDVKYGSAGYGTKEETGGMQRKTGNLDHLNPLGVLIFIVTTTFMT